jgi:DNA-binding transcriptional ArsR family regulator
MRNGKPLDALLPKTRQGILAALLVQPQKAWYASELARRMGVPSSSLQRELKDLTTAGILKTHRQGRMAYFQVNADSPIFPDLQGLLLKTAGLIDVLADVLKPLASKVRVAFVFGSIASSSEQSESDIDLMLVGTVPPAELALPLRRAREVLGCDISPTVYTPAEFRKKRAAKDHFLTRALDRPKLFVIGNSDGLEKVTE